ncbi:hypothetical protein Tco_0669462 [Tanacetum coccineum]
MAGSDAREATQISKSLLQALLVEEFCPSNEMERLENEFWNHKMIGANHVGIKRYMAGLALRLRGMLRINERKSMDELAKVGGSGRDVKKVKGGTNFVAAAPSREGYAGSQPWCAKCHTHHHEKANCKIFLIIKALLIRDHVTQKDTEQYMEDELEELMCTRFILLTVGLQKKCLSQVEPRILTIWESATLGWRRNDRGGGNQVRGRVYNASMNAAEAAKDSVRIMKKTRSPRVLSSIIFFVRLHSVIPTGHLVLAGFIMFLLIVGLISTDHYMFLLMAYCSCWFHMDSCWYVVPTGKVKVPAGRYVVPTGKDNVIVSTRRLEDLSRDGPSSGIRAWLETLC